MADQSRPLEIPGVETFHRREAWQDPNLPVDGPSPTMDEWDTFPLHYTASSNLPDGDPCELGRGRDTRLTSHVEKGKS